MRKWKYILVCLSVIALILFNFFYYYLVQILWIFVFTKPVSHHCPYRMCLPAQRIQWLFHFSERFFSLFSVSARFVFSSLLFFFLNFICFFIVKSKIFCIEARMLEFLARKKQTEWMNELDKTNDFPYNIFWRAKYIVRCALLLYMREPHI